MEFQLFYRKEAYKITGTKWQRDNMTDMTLPDTPPQFTSMRGAHQNIAAEADRLNKVQQRSGFQHYFFFPDVAVY